MTNTIPVEKAKRFDREASLVNMEYLKAKVIIAKTAEKEGINEKVLSSEKTVSHERV